MKVVHSSGAGHLLTVGERERESNPGTRLDIERGGRLGGTREVLQGPLIENGPNKSPPLRCAERYILFNPKSIADSLRKHPSLPPHLDASLISCAAL
jgi:hypothetical protein